MREELGVAGGVRGVGAFQEAMGVERRQVMEKTSS